MLPRTPHGELLVWPCSLPALVHIYTYTHIYTRQARTALLEAEAARGREQQQQALVAQLQQRASQAAAAAAKAARSKVGGAELAALQQAQAMAESVAGGLALAPLP